jgi:O-antigen ligase
MQDKQISLKLLLKHSTVFFAFLALAVAVDEPFILAVPVGVYAVPLFLEKPVRLFYLLLLCIPFSTELMVTDTLGTDFPDELLMLCLSAVILLMYANDISLAETSFFRHPLFAILLLHVGWICIATFYSENVMLSVKYLLAKSWYIIAFVLGIQLFVRTRSQMTFIAMVLVAASLFVAMQSIIRHATYGFTFESIKYVLKPFFRNHVVYAAWLACMVPPLIAMIFLSKESRTKRILMVVLGVIVAAIILSYSRGAWLALIAAGLVAFAVHRRFIKWLSLFAVMIVLSIFYWLSQNNRYIDFRPDYQRTIFHSDFREHMIATYRLQDVSNAERFHRWIAAVRMGADKPLTGFGPNNFYDYYKSHTVSAYKTWVSRNEDRSTTHNYFLLLVAEQGLPALLIFLLLLYLMFSTAERIYHSSADRFYKITALTIAAVLAIIVAENFINDLIETDKIGSLFFLCLGLLTRLHVSPSARGVKH